jgi:hypothetical protein
MPFWSNAEITLKNNNAVPVQDISYEVQVASNDFEQAKTGYFCTQHKTTSVASDGADYVFLDVKGRGHMVGMSMYVEPVGSSLSYLEGDERIYVDGSLTPAIYGTGAEDYFNCGWYYAFDEVSLPYHGCTYKVGGKTHQYRLHITDAIPFNKSITAGIEHGAGNGSSARYTSVAYYYLAGDQPSGMTMVADLDHGNMWSEGLYEYTLASGNTVTGSWRYEGDRDNVIVSDEGYAYNGEFSSFSVSIPESHGLLLRRRSDQGVGGQLAHVFIDDQYAGVWYEPDHRMAGVNKRWIDSEFLVSPNLVAGKTEVEITLLPLGSSPMWNEYRCQVYAILPFVMTPDIDGDLLPDDWELEYASSLEKLDGSQDSDRDGLTDQEEYIAGTDPTSSVSYFALNQNYSFDSEFGRIYRYEECTNLTDGVWYQIIGDIPGNGDIIDLPHEDIPGAGAAFRRIKVEMP